MPIDLCLAAVGLLACCVLAFRLGAAWGRRATTRSNVLLAVSLVVAAGFAWLASGRLWWALLIPSSATILWSNWTPILISLAAGVSLHAMGLRRPMRRATVAALTLLALGGVALPVARSEILPAKDLGNAQWISGVCIQSSGVSCAPAAAATLLYAHRIAAGERALAAACLTGHDGTTPLGLYRGMRLATASSDHVPVIMPRDADELAASEHLPAVALVRLDPPSESTHLVPLDRLLGRHEGHAVVVYGRDEDGFWKVGDPSVGRTQWSDKYFRVHWNGDAIGLSEGASEACMH